MSCDPTFHAQMVLSRMRMITQLFLFHMPSFGDKRGEIMEL